MNIDLKKIYLHIDVAADCLYYNKQVLSRKIKANTFKDVIKIRGSYYISLKSIKDFVGYDINLESLPNYVIVNKKTKEK